MTEATNDSIWIIEKQRLISKLLVISIQRRTGGILFQAVSYIACVFFINMSKHKYKQAWFSFCLCIIKKQNLRVSFFFSIFVKNEFAFFSIKFKNGK